MNGLSHNGNKERVVKAAAGITFSIVLTESGKGKLELKSSTIKIDRQHIFNFFFLQCSPSAVLRRDSSGMGQRENVLPQVIKPRMTLNHNLVAYSPSLGL